MKYACLIVICLISAVAFSQTPAEINKAIGLPDSLNYVSELRVYKSMGTSNLTQVFRLFKPAKDIWKTEFYNYFSAVPESNVAEHFTKQEVTTTNVYYLIWADILSTNIAYLPTQEAIRYKLQGKIEFEDKSDNYGSRRVIQVMDGSSYSIFVRGTEGNNHVYYENPERYLELYPGVDELESVVGLINLIRDNFNIWKE